MGRVQILLDVDVDLTGRDVILVEDIVDTGFDLRYLLGACARAAPRRWKCVARQVGPPDRPDDATLRRVRLPRSIRARLRSRLRRALPQPPRHPPGRRHRRVEGRSRPVGAAARAGLTVARPPTRGYARHDDDRDGTHRRAGRAHRGQPIVLLREREVSDTSDLDRCGRSRCDRPVAAGRGHASPMTHDLLRTILEDLRSTSDASRSPSCASRRSTPPSR